MLLGGPLWVARQSLPGRTRQARDLL